LGNPHVGDESNTSFHSQISSVFKVEGKKNLYIAVADRWLPEKKYMDVPYQLYADSFEAVFDSECGKKADWSAFPSTRTADISIADYVWLPLRFEGEMVYIDWKDKWSLDDYE